MALLDDYLQRVRIKKAMPYIPDQAIALDIGCHKGELFIKLGKKLGYGVGIDPILEKDIIKEKYELHRDTFPSTRATTKLYHCITMLAVLEHIQPDQQIATIKACYDLLRQNGVVVVTVPDKQVDKILSILRKLRLVKGMQLDEHYGFDVSQTFGLFATAGFILVVHKKFQFGLNNLFVFKK
jgi:2-polyprenyl-3-methyl-5-hydroxy-6-metoxy-1,4-benzoquinol methylase